MERSVARGFSLTDGGYYFAVSDYFDLSLKGSLYANGSWLATAQTNYKRLYKYSGNFSFSYANNIAGQKDCQITVNQPITGWDGPLPRMQKLLRDQDSLPV